MESNLLLEQFSRYKKMELEASPFHFLLDSNIELNPHQKQVVLSWRMRLALERQSRQVLC